MTEVWGREAFCRSPRVGACPGLTTDRFEGRKATGHWR
uniref:Uncharacterized protein n=1 Tax=Rhizobium meliloti TaxID=382 RepID=Q52919_RHIML|nr:hypothetical protein [Sinorhizobium meliloti]